MCFKEGVISNLCSKLLKLVDQFIYLGGNISCTECDVNICLAKVWNTMDRLMFIWEKARWKLYKNATCCFPQLYSHQPLISQTIQVWQIIHAGHYWRSKDKLISNVSLQTFTYGLARVGWPAKTYVHQICMKPGCSLEDLPGAIDDRDG